MHSLKQNVLQIILSKLDKLIQILILILNYTKICIQFKS